jgi:ABC-type transport system involved in cytochrome c biogenesis permease component
MGRTTFTSGGLEGRGEEVALHLLLGSPLFSFLAAASSALAIGTIGIG